MFSLLLDLPWQVARGALAPLLTEDLSSWKMWEEFQQLIQQLG
jgi:hypothetical protein